MNGGGCFVDVCVFYHLATSNTSSLSSYYHQHENIKKCVYAQRVREVMPGPNYITLQLGKAIRQS